MTVFDQKTPPHKPTPVTKDGTFVLSSKSPTTFPTFCCYRYRYHLCYYYYCSLLATARTRDQHFWSYSGGSIDTSPSCLLLPLLSSFLNVLLPQLGRFPSNVHQRLQRSPPFSLTLFLLFFALYLPLVANNHTAIPPRLIGYRNIIGYHGI